MRVAGHLDVESFGSPNPREKYRISPLNGLGDGNMSARA